MSLRTLAPYVDYMATFSNDNDAEVPVLLWSSRRPSPSTSDLTSLPAFGEDPNTVFASFNVKESARTWGEDDGEESTTDSPSPSGDGRRRSSISQHRVTYNIEGEGAVVSEDATTDSRDIAPSEEWKSSFRSIWKMHCPLPARNKGR